MGRHSLGRSPGDLGSAPAAAAAPGGEAMSSARGLSGAGMGLPRRTQPSVKDRPAAVTAATDGGSDRRSGQAASAPAAFPTASGVRGGGEDRGGDVVIGSVVSANVRDLQISKKGL